MIVPLRTCTVGRDCWVLVCAAIVGSADGPPPGLPPTLGRVFISQALSATAPAVVSSAIRTKTDVVLVLDLGISPYQSPSRPEARSAPDLSPAQDMLAHSQV